MKTIILTIGLLLASPLAWSNTDTEATKNFSSALYEFDTQHDFFGYVDRGSVSLLNEEGVIRLVVFSHLICDGLQTCPTVLPELHEIQLPLISEETGACDITTYRAELDNTEVDGLLEVIEVKDFSNASCRRLYPHMTEVTYKSFNPRADQWTESFFAAETLAEGLIAEPQKVNTHPTW